MEDKKTKISYDVEADILRMEISEKPIDYAKEMGNVIIHFTKDGLPVYLEILEAKGFLMRSKQILESINNPKFA
ncbi:MAG: DUF2283 domain-containing protein [bacterium]|nr:DUF2283 domain-containing protein [bacterium]